MNEDNILFFDTETTGFPEWKLPSGSPEQPHLVQLAAILCDRQSQQIVAEMNVIIKPDEWVIPQETIDVHGITNEYANEHGIPEKEALEMLLKMANRAVERNAYNKTFDQRIVRIACKRYTDEATVEKWAIKDDHSCSMRMAQKILGGRSPKLAAAYEYFTGDELVGAHDAMADTKACMKVYYAILQQP